MCFIVSADGLTTLRQRHADAAQLRNADERDLRDIGINRGDIERLFDPAFAQEYAERGQPRVSAPEKRRRVVKCKAQAPVVTSPSNVSPTCRPESEMAPSCPLTEPSGPIAPVMSVAWFQR